VQAPVSDDFLRPGNLHIGLICNASSLLARNPSYTSMYQQLQRKLGA
jgi:hypothetical protein